MEKQETLEELNKKIRWILQPEIRSAIGVNGENQNSSKNYIFPDKLKQSINRIYQSLSELSLRYGVSTISISVLIEDSQYASEGLAIQEYVKKATAVQERIDKVLQQINAEFEENGKIDKLKDKEKLEEGLESGAENETLRLTLIEELNKRVKQIREKMEKTLLDKGIRDDRLYQIRKEIDEFRNFRTGEEIQEALATDDYNAKKVLLDTFEEYANEINKTKHQEYTDTIHVDLPPFEFPKSVKEADENVQEKRKYSRYVRTTRRYSTIRRI